MAMVDTVYWLPIIGRPAAQAVGLVQRSAATWRGAVSVFIAWTGWTLAVALLWRQHHKYCRGWYSNERNRIILLPKWFQQIMHQNLSVWHALKKLVPETCINARDQNYADWLLSYVWKFLLLNSSIWPASFWYNFLECVTAIKMDK